MTRAPMLALLAAALTLPTCASWKASGGARVQPPDTALTAPCTRPEDHLGGDWKVIAGRLGVALIRCGQQKEALVAWADEVVAIFGRTRNSDQR